MARYDYLCKSCNLVTEETRPMSMSTKPGKCPKCEKKTERIISGRPGIIVVGGTTRG